MRINNSLSKKEVGAPLGQRMAKQEDEQLVLEGNTVHSTLQNKDSDKDLVKVSAGEGQDEGFGARVHRREE